MGVPAAAPLPVAPAPTAAAAETGGVSTRLLALVAGSVGCMVIVVLAAGLALWAVTSVESATREPAPTAPVDPFVDPSVAEDPAAHVDPNTASTAPPFAIGQRWSGHMACASGQETLTISIRGRGPVNYIAVITLRSPEFRQELHVDGTLDGSGRFFLENRNDNMHTRVSPFVLRGQLGPNATVITGTSDRGGCPRFELRRDGPR